jgi:hypothetical protein
MDEYRPSAEELSEAVSCAYQVGFRRSYFSRQALEWARKFMEAHPEIQSVEEVVAILERERNHDGQRA